MLFVLTVISPTGKGNKPMTPEQILVLVKDTLDLFGLTNYIYAMVIIMVVAMVVAVIRNR